MTCVSNRASVHRRRVLQALARLALGAGAGAVSPFAPAVETPAGSSVAARSSHFPFGPVVPTRAIPAWPVITHEGRRTDLGSLLQGRTSALQLMFTGCSATCPIQGALFAEAQRRLPASAGRLQLVSISIDPLADTPASLARWLRGFAALPGWVAAVPQAGDLDGIFDVLGSGGESRPGGTDRHTGQVYIVDSRCRLTYRTPSMPAVGQIVDRLRLIDETT